MEEFVGALTGGAIWGIGFGVALGLARSAGGGLRPLVKDAMKGAIAVGDWVSGAVAEGRETVEDLYHEAKTEQQARE